MPKVREFTNGLTHCIAAVLAIIGTVILLVVSPKDPWHLTGFIIFGIGEILVYTASTIYHWVNFSENSTRLLRRFDHSSIFVSIAASYTPLCLIPLKGPWGLGLLIAIWVMALAGILMKMFWMDAPRRLSTVLYILMGWTVILVFPALIRSTPLPAVLWLIAGGVLYTIGAVIYARKKPNFKHLDFHAIFHIFVAAGMLCHFWMMIRYIARIPVA